MGVVELAIETNKYGFGVIERQNGIRFHLCAFVCVLSICDTRRIFNFADMMHFQMRAIFIIDAATTTNLGGITSNYNSNNHNSNSSRGSGIHSINRKFLHYWWLHGTKV